MFCLLRSKKTQIMAVRPYFERECGRISGGGAIASRNRRPREPRGALWLEAFWYGSLRSLTEIIGPVALPGTSRGTGYFCCSKMDQLATWAPATRHRGRLGKVLYAVCSLSLSWLGLKSCADTRVCAPVAPKNDITSRVSADNIGNRTVKTSAR